MCGIVGYIGSKRAKDILLEMLKLLEYRGYDSAGVLLGNNRQRKIIKCTGPIVNLIEKTSNETNKYTFGIGHTRWATNGPPTENNAHPQEDEKKNWAVVHNGIIENEKTLKKELEENGVTFQSDTDTEVLPNLFSNEKTIDNIIDSLKKVKGTYSLAITNKSTPNEIFLAKNKSPLYVAIKDNETFIASDPIAFSNFSNTFYILEDDEYCICEKGKIKFYDKQKRIVAKKETSICFSKETINNKKEHHFMLKEINETSDVLRKIIKNYAFFSKKTKKMQYFLKIKPKFIYFIGCGTAYHSGVMASCFFEENLRIKSRAYIASEFKFSPPSLNKNDLCVFISQSGETADTISCLELAKKMKAKCIAITNTPHSTIARMSDEFFDVFAGPEQAVASTKAYIAQLCVLNILCLMKKNKKEYTSYIDSINNSLHLFDKIIEYSKLRLVQITDKIIKSKNIFFIGKGKDYITSKEASLKLKEITYINSTAIPSGELKHGTLALIDDESYVIVLATDKTTLSKNINSINEIKSRGGNIICFTPYSSTLSSLSETDFFFQIPELPNTLYDIASIIPLQLLAYFVSCSKGINPDKPRNLAKSVTVE